MGIIALPCHISFQGLSQSTNRQSLDSWEEVISTVKDGKAFIRQYGEIKKPIPVENVYAFKLEGTNHLIDITLQVREELRKELQKI